MILRRFMQHVREQNWFAVGLDVIVVIVGIFLGLQVQAWYEARAEREEEQLYLERLLEDFTQSIEINEFSHNIARQRVGNVQLILESLSACELAVEDRDRFANGLFRMGKFLPLRLRGTVIDELKSTGKFQLIENLNIRSAISEHIDSVENVQTVTNSIRSSIGPHILVLEKEYSNKIVETGLSPAMDTRTWDQIEVNFEELCSNSEAIRAISHIHSYTKGLSLFTGPAIAAQREIKIILEQELERFQ